MSTPLCLRSRSRPGRFCLLPPLVRLAEWLHLDLPHLHHRPHDALRLLRIGIADQLLQQRGDDLPGDAVLVLEPAARAFLASFGPLLPQLVDLSLGLAVDEERDRLL